MQSSQLLIVLKSFNRKDIALFDRYLHSPYFHKKKLNQDLLTFWDYVKTGLPKKDRAYFEKQRVAQKLFLKQVNYKSKVEKLMSQLYTQIKQFLIVQQSRKGLRPQNATLLLLQAFSERKLSAPSKQTYRQLQKMSFPKEAQWKASDFYDQFQSQRQISNFQSWDNNRKNDLNLPPTHFALDLFYLTAKFEHALQLQARDLFVFPIDSTDSLQFLQAISPLLKSEHLEFPIIKIYLAAHQLLEGFHQKEAKQLQTHFNQLLKQYSKQMPHELLTTLQTLNRNFAVFQYQRGKAAYLQLTFQLYQEHLEQGFLYQADQILHGTLSNIVQIGLRNKAYDWVHQFLHDHRDRIGGSKDPEIVFRYNLGQYYFSIQEYDKALDQIAATYEDQFYKVAARRLEVKTHYELESEIFEAKLNAFKIYIYRLGENTAHSNHKVRNHNFVDLLKRIWRPNTYKNPVRIKKLLQQARQSVHLADKEWIIEKLEALK